MNRQEWLDWRQGKIGASDAPAIMGVSPWQTPYQKWEEKVFGVKQKENPSMSRGIALESSALSWFENKMGIKLNSQERLTHPSIPYMIATLDGRSHDKEIVVEIKCAGKNDHSAALRKEIPEHYMPQLQHQIEVSHVDMLYYVSFDGNEGVIVEVERNQKYIDKILKEEASFYDCMINITPPALTERDYEERGKDWISAADQLYSIEQKIKGLTKEKEDLRESLISMSSEKNSRGGSYQFTKIAVKGRVDYDKVPELANINLENYRKNASIQWRLSCKL